MKDKRARLLEIIMEIQELYPELDRLMLDDANDPQQIIIASEGRISEIAEEAGLDVEFLDSFFEETDDELDLPDPFDFDDGDDGSGGVLQ